jgi:RNA-directed DNA polymerase
VQLKQWKRGKTTYRALRRLGASELLARQVAARTRHWWRASSTLLHHVLNNRYFDQRGVPRLGTS